MSVCLSINFFPFKYLYRKSTLGIEILVGTNNLKSGGKYYHAEHFKIHEDYHKGRHLNDIAVLRVIGKFEFDENVQPIELSREHVPEGAVAEFAGWGRTVCNALKVIHFAYGNLPFSIRFIIESRR